jgi:predicted O-linked N-acetylglucosamine transferase (SPINDLY family)
MIYHSDYDARAVAEENRRWNLQHAEALREFIKSHSNDRSPDRRLRIGYVSSDFREHVVGRNILPLFQQHDRTNFEIFCYAQVSRPDAMTRLLQQSTDAWRDIARLSDQELADQIRADQIDILMDLAGHTADNRLLAFARKPAPVQVTYLGSCGSTGMPAMDYRFSDPHIDPPDTDLSCYSEKTIRLPRSYWCYRPSLEPTPDPSPTPAIENRFITFGSLNNFAKISPAAQDLWAKILLAVPNSRMLIHAPLGRHRINLARRLERRGITKDRLHFVGPQPWTQYMQTYSQIDITLDPFPYGGNITACDALWMGVAVVTLSGQTAVGRGGRSILTNLGLPELIAYSEKQYIQIATDLAADLDRLSILRRAMRPRMLASPLMDAKAFARDVESAYRRMWRTWIAG